MGKGSGSTTSTSSYSPPPAVSKAYTDLLALAVPQSQQPYPNYGQGQYYTAQEYQPQLVSPMTPDQIMAQQNVAQLSGYVQPYINAATQLTEQASTPIQLQQFSNQAVNQYMSPYMQDVYNSTVSNINETNAQQQQQLQSNAIARGAYGGDRAGIAQAELARQQNLANNATLANLANTGYTSALGEFNNQQAQNAQQDYINRQLAAGAGTQLANLGGYGQNAANQQAQLQYQMGAAQQQQDQAGLSTAYQQFLNANAYPYQQLGWLGQLVSGAATGMGGTTTGSVPSPSGLSQAIGGIGALGTLGNVFGGGGGAAGAAGAGGAGGFLSGLGSGLGSAASGLGSAASGILEGIGSAFAFLSDERMKENIEPVGKTFDGQNIYKYNYKGDPRTQIGLIAQEVEHRHPDAVHSIDGMKTVNYDAATQGAAHRGHFDAGGGVGAIGMSPQQMIPQVGNMQANPHVPALPKMDKNPNEISTDKLKDAVKGIKSLMGKSDTPTANTAPTTSAPNTDLAVDKYRGGVVGYADGGTPTDTSSDAANLAKYGDVLTQDYQNIFGRAPDTAGEQYWANQLGGGAVSQDDLIKSLISGAQGADVGAAQTYTNTQNLKQYDPILQADYQKLFGRAPDAAGEQYWANQLGGGAVSQDNLIKSLISGAQGADVGAAKKYSDSLAGKTTTTPTTTTTTNTTKTPTTTTTGTTGGTTTTTTPTTTTGKVDTTPAPGMGGKPVPVGTLATPGTQSLGDAYRNYQALAHSGHAKYSNLLAGYNNYMNARGQTSAPASTSSTTDSSSTATPTAPAAKTQATTAAPTTTKAATTTPVSNQNTSVVIPEFEPSITNVPQSTYNPGVGQDAYAQSMALQNAANAKSGLNLNFGQADPSAWKNLSAADAAKLTAGETPYTALPSNLQNPGYMANLDAVRSDPVIEAALQGAIAAHIPGFTIANRGGRINGYETGGGIKNYGGMKTVKDLEQFAEDVVGSGAYGEAANVFTPTASKDILAARGGVIGYQDGGPPSDQGLAALSDDAMDNYARAISPTESGGKYNITGPVSRKGDMPYGKYQVMGSNIPSWTEAATGKRMTPQEFLNDPDAQEATFRHRFGSLVKQYGNPQDAASVWHSGVPLAEAKEQGRRDVNMTTSNYVDRFNNMLSATPGGQDLLKQINSQGSRPTDQQQLTGSQQRMQQTGVNQVPTKEGLSGALGIAMTDNQRLAAFQAFAKMASTPGSFGRGLAAAADTYASTLLAANKQQTEQAKAESDIGYKKAETAEKQLRQSGNTTQFISQTPEGGVKVESQIIRPGTTSTFGSQGQQQAPAGFTPQQGGQGAGPSAPTAPTSPEVLGPIPVEGSKPNTMSVLTELGQQAQNTGGLTDKALERSQTQYAKDSEEAYNEANVARNTRGDISTMVKAVSEIGSGGLTGFGPDASARNALAQYINTGLKSLKDQLKELIENSLGRM